MTGDKERHDFGVDTFKKVRFAKNGKSFSYYLLIIKRRHRMDRKGRVEYC